MPLEVRVDVIPGDVEAARSNLGKLTITQVSKLDDDPGGLRLYEVKGGWTGERVTFVQHARADGAMELARKALAADLGYQVG